MTEMRFGGGVGDRVRDRRRTGERRRGDRDRDLWRRGGDRRRGDGDRRRRGGDRRLNVVV